MKTPYENQLVHDIPLKKIGDIEEHCRKIHAEAVVHGFVLLVTVPIKIVREILQDNKRETTNITRTNTLKGSPIN